MPHQTLAGQRTFIDSAFGTGSFVRRVEGVIGYADGMDLRDKETERVGQCAQRCPYLVPLVVVFGREVARATERTY